MIWASFVPLGALSSFVVPVLSRSDASRGNYFRRSIDENKIRGNVGRVGRYGGAARVYYGSAGRQAGGRQAVRPRSWSAVRSGRRRLSLTIMCIRLRVVLFVVPIDEKKEFGTRCAGYGIGWFVPFSRSIDERVGQYTCVNIPNERRVRKKALCDE